MSGRPEDNRSPTRASAASGPMGLTRAGQKLVAILLDPRYAKATVRERARAAGISERRYYELMHDDAVHEALRLKARELLTPYLAPILEAAAETARVPGRDGHQDRRMLLEMGEWYAPRQRQEISGPGGEPLQVRFVDPTAPADSGLGGDA